MSREREDERKRERGSLVLGLPTRRALRSALANGKRSQPHISREVSMTSTKVQTDVASIRKLESAVAQLERQGKAAPVAYERWGTEPLTHALKESRAAYKQYASELRTAKGESK